MVNSRVTGTKHNFHLFIAWLTILDMAWYGKEPKYVCVFVF